MDEGSHYALRTRGLGFGIASLLVFKGAQSALLQRINHSSYLTLSPFEARDYLHITLTSYTFSRGVFNRWGVLRIFTECFATPGRFTLPVCKRPEACFGAPASATGRGDSRFRRVSHRQPVVSATVFHPRGVFLDMGCFVRRGVTSRRYAHSAGVKRPVGAFSADGDGVRRSGGVLCTNGVRGFTYQWGVTLLTPRGVPLSTPPSSVKHTRNRRVMLQERFHRDYRRICARIVPLSAVDIGLWTAFAIEI
jgi:hypothetical protein